MGFHVHKSCLLWGPTSMHEIYLAGLLLESGWLPRSFCMVPVAMAHRHGRPLLSKDMKNAPFVTFLRNRIKFKAKDITFYISAYIYIWRCT